MRISSRTLTFPLLALSLAVLLAHCRAEAAVASPIQHVIALMFENRSFDHLLGHLKKFNPEIRGLTGTESNPLDPSDPHSPRITVSFDAPDVLPFNPGHSLHSTTEEIFGSASDSGPANMEGFVYEGIKVALGEGKSKEDGLAVMKCYNQTSLSVLSTLALEFGVIDEWHSSIPGPTLPNRAFALSGSSNGLSGGNIDAEIDGLPQKTIMNDLEEAGLDWGVFWGDFPFSLIQEQIRPYALSNIHTHESLFEKMEANTLPAFSWVEPKYFTFLDWMESDQHPKQGTDDFFDGDIWHGEFLLKSVYEKLRASPSWNSTLLVVYYDEHGGTADFSIPPSSNIPAPDGPVNERFDFKRLGVRVPAVLVSPWIEKGTVMHDGAGGSFIDHTSLLATLRKIFPSLSQEPLTKREAAAASVEGILNAKSARTDCPTSLPLAPQSDAAWKRFVRSEAVPDTLANIASLMNSHKNLEAIQEKSPQMTDLQEEVVVTARACLDAQLASHSLLLEEEPRTEFEGALFVRKVMHQLKMK
eukprot:TRINITY_DN8871_c0_g1_i1.p1 TRINITY_DN8871_c0_g1~~TRINITY_DN8871_c0_g1_i1.p1  ORF type:complete len:540 (+),score=110.72 TRINITY_DN8871_c0_g1_i1:38-1621(+)